jgi:hypothetical protein
MLYPVDTGKGREIGCVSSVSGGSLASGMIALSTDIRSTSPEEFHENVRRVVRA